MLAKIVSLSRTNGLVHAVVETMHAPSGSLSIQESVVSGSRDKMANSFRIRRKAEAPIAATRAPSDEMCNFAIIDKAVEIAERRRQILSDMRTAICRNDRELVFVLAKKLTGLSDETSRRVDQGIN